MRIRTESGKRTLIGKFKTTDKINSVYEAVKAFIENKDKAFVLRTTFPNKAFEADDTKTLKELGLAPSSALVI